MRHNSLNDNRQQVPLHELLWSLGRSLIQGKTEAQPDGLSIRDYDDAMLTQKLQAATVQQLTTSMRMHGISGDDDTMLTSLAAMALAGEITFHDFIGRIQNLFPHLLDMLDVTLRMKIAAQVLPE